MMADQTQGNIVFLETQRFRKAWFYVIVLPCSLFLAGFFGFAMFRQLASGIPFGPDPIPDALLWVLGPFIICLGAVLIFIFAVFRLTTTVRNDGLFVRFAPFFSRKFDFQNIDHCEARTYRPLKEYGGWGIRGGRKNRAYNVKGNRGVQLRFTDGTRLLIGSQRAGELAAAILKMMKG
jgi:hypothetical protein